MKYTTIVFDCDGTLLDTLTDLRNAVNYVLRTHDLPERSIPEVKAALGNGVAHLDASITARFHFGGSV